LSKRGKHTKKKKKQNKTKKGSTRDEGNFDGTLILLKKRGLTTRMGTKGRSLYKERGHRCILGNSRQR